MRQLAVEMAKRLRRRFTTRRCPVVRQTSDDVLDRLTVRNHRRKLPQPAPEPAFGALHDKPPPAATNSRHRVRLAAHADLLFLNWQRCHAIVGQRPAVVPDGAMIALRSRAGRADRRPQFHHGLVEVSAASIGSQRIRVQRDFLLAACRRRVAAQAEEPSDHPIDVPIHDGRLLPEGDGCNRRGTIRPDARELSQFVSCLRKSPAKLIDDHLRGAMHIPRSGIVSQPRPELEHGPQVCRGEPIDGRIV